MFTGLVLKAKPELTIAPPPSSQLVPELALSSTGFPWSS